MKGDSDVIELLNEVLTHELTAINQYFIHSKMCKDWGFMKLAKRKWDESIEEMKHADKVIERILFLEGTPNMQRMNPVRVGEDAIEQHRLDLDLEMEALDRLKKGIDLCWDKHDTGTRELLEHILGEEEEGVDWLETQLSLVATVGKERYLSEMIGADED